MWGVRHQVFCLQNICQPRFWIVVFRSIICRQHAFKDPKILWNISDHILKLWRFSYFPETETLHIKSKAGNDFIIHNKISKRTSVSSICGKPAVKKWCKYNRMLTFLWNKKKNIGITIPGKWSFIMKSGQFHEVTSNPVDFTWNPPVISKNNWFKWDSSLSPGLSYRIKWISYEIYQIHKWNPQWNP